MSLILGRLFLRLRKNKPLTTTTINDLCFILNCNIVDIAVYIPSEDDQRL
ncbi:MAG: helix-turn-helix transcriptional regulator [Eubacterium sp.]|nr:helix-turn-helix transcriptional regulator [Eubacterium sp.]